MITYLNTSLLTSNSQTVVNTINTVGVMGKGLAAEFKKRYPEMFARYKELCANREIEIGKLWLWKAPTQWVLNFPTKVNWRNPSKLEYIERGLQKFVDGYSTRGIYEISFPRLGCGNGELDWNEVKPLMEKYLGKLPIKIYIHDYSAEIGIPEHRSNESLAATKALSFDSFMLDVADVITKAHGKFKTIETDIEFSAMLRGTGTEAELIVQNHKTANVDSDELYDIWTALLSGPLSIETLPGRARGEASYLFPILTQLPYIRQIEKWQRVSEGPSVAIELNSVRNQTSDIEAAPIGDPRDAAKWG